MLKSTQSRIKALINEHWDSGTVPTMADVEMLNPISEYVDPTRLEKERQEFFLRAPTIFCHQAEVPTPNSYFAEEMTGIPVLVVRQKDNSVKAFLNVCRHRGVNVVENGAGSQPRFVCQFHGWSYKTDGSLASIPTRTAFDGIDFSCYGLTELPCEVRHGLVWIVLTPGVPLDVAAYLGELDEEIAAYTMEKFVPIQRHYLEDDLNWKLAIDGFLESYHISSLHRETIDPYIRNNFGIFEAVGKHGRMVTTRKVIDNVRKLPDDEWDLLPYVGVIYQLFPHNLLLWQGGDRMTYWVSYSRGDPNKSLSRVSIMVEPEEAPKTEKWARRWDLVRRTVVDEDFVTARAAQKSFHSGAQDTMIFGKNEPALQHFHKNLAEALNLAD